MSDDLSLLARPAPRNDPADDAPPEYLTVLSRDPSPAALAYHKQHLGAQGYAIAGRIERHCFQMIGPNGKAETLFDGEPLYAAIFVRRAKRHSD